MDRIVFTAGGGAARTLEHQATVSNNLANASSPGFRAQLTQYRAVPIIGAGLATRVGTVAATPGADFTPGPMEVTGRALDIAIQGSGWLSALMPDGSEGLTRAGGLQIGADGTLQTADGRQLLSVDNQPVVVPEGASLTIGTDGTLTALGAGDDPVGLIGLGQLKLSDPNPASLVRGGDGYFRVQGQPLGQPVPADPLVRVVSGAVEGSNVSPIEAMVSMIDNGRRFEMQMKVVQHADTNAERANRLLSAG
ncbi:flagellar basal body rod protein FlgF [Verticiella sediminum]|uniref:Flagellar basal-body rod protein FlgF n=1 Tax=Verticiella sediminum TaxID=1247510 RepID=A0A556ARX4_9BURK|nr:flagellar basal body rod protein FlgF [Verticiella sediminum]TSH95678.1 flagellar basal body rod protein FlgF [Verticiella sediminum]